jgi:prepilin signal peptidase PulO-like enzyme (type II secretory pathway)
MGGGDLKLLTVALLWAGIGGVLPFLVIMVCAALLQMLAGRLGWIRVQYIDKRMKIAFAPSIAAGLIGIFMLGVLRPLPEAPVSAPSSQSMPAPLR